MLRESSPVERDLCVCLTASWIWVKGVPWQPKRPTMSWGKSGTALLMVVCPTSCFASAGPPQAPCAVLGTTVFEELWTVSRAERPRCWKASRARLTKSGWSHFEPHHTGRAADLSIAGDQEEIEWSCDWRNSDWTLGNVSSLRGWSWNGLPREVVLAPTLTV